MLTKIFQTIVLSFCVIFFSSEVNALPEIFSPEDFGPTVCVGCCDENGNQLPSDPLCGCDPVDQCGVCNGDGSSCGCELFDCAGNPFPDPLPYCHLDVNKDKRIDITDSQAVINYLQAGGSSAVTDTNKKYDTSKDGVVTSRDALVVVNFLNLPIPGVVKVDSCGICGGSGFNVCGTCTNAPNAVLPEGPNGVCGCPNQPNYVGPYNSDCQICSNLGKDSCNRCPGTPNYNSPSCCPAGQVDVGCGCGLPGPSGCDNVCGSTKVDLGCGCGITGPSGCDNQCGSSKVADSCGVCGGDGSTCPKACEYIKASVTRVGDQTHFANKTLSDSEIFKTYGDATGLPCIQQMISSLLHDARHQGNYKDDYVAAAFADRFMGDQGGGIVTGHSGENINKTTATYHCSNKIWTHPYKARNYCTNGYFVMDKSCNVVPLSHLDEACGELKVEFVRSTPISLVWEDGADQIEEISLVSFPLNPTLSGKSYMWKGSAKLPLLVYDPEHKGEIKSASQLFGNWTFGGQNSASMSESAFGRPWNNGFEALATLDTNYDGKVSDDELSSLGLWFDANMDAISQPGEVKPLSEVNVKALFYKIDHVDELRNSVVASKGFEVEVEGRSEIKRSIDWFGATADSKYELMKSSVLKTLSFTDSLNKEPETSSKESPYASAEMPDLDKRWSGSWKWSLEEEAGVSIEDQGVIVLDVFSNGKVLGYSLVPHAFEQGSQSKAAMALGFFKVEGETNVAGDGTSTLSFKSKQDKSEVNTKVSISEDGSKLYGVSSASLSSAGVSKKVTYKWVAERLETLK